MSWQRKHGFGNDCKAKDDNDQRTRARSTRSHVQVSCDGVSSVNVVLKSNDIYVLSKLFGRAEYSFRCVMEKRATEKEMYKMDVQNIFMCTNKK